MLSKDILDCTEELISQKGLNFSLAELASKLGVKPPSLYNHFESKEKIVKATIYREIESFYVYVNHVLDSIVVENLEVWLEEFFIQTLGYFESLQKARFWRHYSLLEPSFKDLFSQHRAQYGIFEYL